MIFRIQDDLAFMKDLRHVPFIIGALYGGRRIAFLLLLVLIGFRFTWGMDGITEVIIVNLLLFVTLWFTIPWFKKHENPRKRVKASIFVSSLGILYIVIIYFVEITLHIRSLNIEIINLISVLFIVQCLTTCLFVYFIEKMSYSFFVTEELKRLEKINTVSEIAASISHEVRNPLTITRGFIQMLRDESITREKREKYIAHSLEELDRASSIISDYLTFAKPSMENMKQLDVKKELLYVINLVNPYAMINDVEIKLDATKENLLVQGEAQKLHQCFINIIKNSIEAMPDGGVIEVQISKSERYNHVLIVIRDNGLGMTEEQVSRLGTPYFTTKSNGTGLGMMVVYSIIQTMNGVINVESEVGKGTSFTIRFPLKQNYEFDVESRKDDV